MLLKDRRFFPLFWTQFLGALNDNFFKNALVILLTYQSVSIFGLNSSMLVALAGGVFIFPFFIFSATAGQIADRYEKSDLIRLTKTFELIIMLISVVGLLSESYEILFVTLFLMGTQSAFFGPLKYGILPYAVKRDELVQANCYVSMGTFLAILIGTILGGIGASFENYKITISIGIIFYAILGIIFSKKINPVGSDNSNIKVDYTLALSTWKILRLTFRSKKMLHTIWGISWFWFLGAAILSLIPTFAKEIIGGQESVGTLFLAMFTLGMGTGSLIVGKISKGKVELGLAALSALFMSFFLLDLGYCSFKWSSNTVELLSLSEFISQDYSYRIIIDLFMFSVFGGGYIVPQMTYLQDETDKSFLSRAIGANNIWNALFMVSAAIFIIVLNDQGVSKLFIILAILNLIASIVVFYKYPEQTLRLMQEFLVGRFYKIDLQGEFKVPEDKSCIIAINHLSFIDWLFINAISPRSVRFVIDYSYYKKIPKIFSFVLRHVGMIPIATRRESEEVLKMAFEGVQEAVNAGDYIGIFPEGFISRDQELGKMKPGISKIVRENNVGVIPVAISGLWGSWFSFGGKKPFAGMPTFRKRKVKIVVGSYISPDNFEREYLFEFYQDHVNDYVGES